MLHVPFSKLRYRDASHNRISFALDALLFLPDVLESILFMGAL